MMFSICWFSGLMLINHQKMFSYVMQPIDEGLPGLCPWAPIEVKAHTYSPTQYIGTLENIHLVSTRHRLYVLLGDDFDDLVDCSFSK